ncbi:bacteriochlorophyll 4-vinyl reductase [Bradyrhizobium sp.]|uniref:bacteriochlorophyll 4-vinyl reductase n=1 Tax=Bradyrhizobium sp. TaxID=376 RepID=UPI003C6F7A00
MSSAPAIATRDERAGRIGPNAVTRVAEALWAVEGAHAVSRVFRAANLEPYLSDPPSQMIGEHEVASLHRALHVALGDDRARTVGWIAGQRTADYLLRHRIPFSAQIAMRSMPCGLAGRLLTAAIAGNAWTFVGTGAFSARHGRPMTFTIRNCLICRGQTSAAPCCDFYAATFERLFARLVHARTRVSVIACQATGEPACAFAIKC